MNDVTRRTWERVVCFVKVESFGNEQNMLSNGRLEIMASIGKIAST